MTGFSEGLGTFVAAFSFWAAVAMLGVSGLLALSRASRRPGFVFGGLIGALLIVGAPTIMATSSDLAGGVTRGEGGGTARPGVMEYAATLSLDWLWTAGIVVAVWVVALVATIAAALSRLGSTAE